MADTTKTDPEKVIATEQDRGYRGVLVDPTPNANYTVAGVTSGKPTPETDDKAREAARKAATAAVHR